MRFNYLNFKVLTICSFFFLIACNSTPKSAEADTAEARTLQATSVQGTILNIDTANSKIFWKGSKLIGGANSGFVPITTGSIKLVKGEVVGGSVTINMKGIQPTNQDAEGNAKLKAHLGSSDFFAVDSFPTVVFDVTEVKKGAITDSINAEVKDNNATVTGNLTIKGIAKSISFPAHIQADSLGAVLNAAFTIDRTKWGITYGAENSIRDNIIKKEIEFKVDVTAKK